MPRDSHALPLTAGKLCRLLFALPFQRNQRQKLLCPLPAFRLADAARLKPEGDILPNGHQRKQRKALEDQRGRALVGAEPRHILLADENAACGRLQEAGNHAQDRRLAAAGRTQNGKKLTGLDGEIGWLHCGELAEAHRDAFKRDVVALQGHVCSAPENRNRTPEVSGVRRSRQITQAFVILST